MSLNKFLILMGVATGFSWLAWVVVLFYVDPEISGTVGVLVFYAALYMALLGSFVLLGLAARLGIKKFKREEVIAFKHLSPSIRQAIWFASVVAISLMLQHRQIFSWFSSGVLLLSFVILEGFFLSRNLNNNPKKQSPA